MPDHATYSRILVGTDGSDSATLAVAHALHLGRALDAEITLLAAYSPDEGGLRGPGTPLSREEARAVLGDTVSSYAGSGRMRTRHVVGPVHRALLGAAVDDDAGLLVVGSRSTGRPGAGLVRLLLEDPPCDVLVVDTIGARRPEYRRIAFVAASGSGSGSGAGSGSGQATPSEVTARSLAAAFGAELDLVPAARGRIGGTGFVSPDPGSPGASGSSGGGGSDAAQGESPPVGRHVDLSQSGRYDLIVLGRAAAGSGLRGGRLARLIEKAGTNVLVVRTEDDAPRARRNRTGKEPRMARGGPEALVDVPLFSGLSRRHLRHIAGLCEEEEFPEDTALAEEGKPGDTFYVLLEGEAKVVRGGRRLDRLIPGDFFGEIALIDGGPRTASVVATTPVTTLTISRKRFRRMLEEDPSIVLAMLEELAKRLRNNERSPTG
jgi:CRP/FNR family transcriptional regulator, cyclic AMP receptor protein